MPLAASAPDDVTLLRYLDMVLIVVAAPILLLIGVPAVGYGAGAGAWIGLRVAGVAVEHAATASTDVNRQVTLRLAFLMTRLFLLALVVILVRKGSGQNAGLAALLVIVFAYTVSLFLSFLNRPRRPGSPTPSR